MVYYTPLNQTLVNSVVISVISVVFSVISVNRLTPRDRTKWTGIFALFHRFLSRHPQTLILGITDFHCILSRHHRNSSHAVTYKILCHWVTSPAGWNSDFNLIFENGYNSGRICRIKKNIRQLFFQEKSIYGISRPKHACVTGGIKSVTYELTNQHSCTNQKQYAPPTFMKVGEIKIILIGFRISRN